MKGSFGAGIGHGEKVVVAAYALGALLLHGISSLWFVLKGYAAEEAFIDVPLRIAGLAVCALAVAAVIVLSVLKKDRPCMGLFFFGLAGMVFFVISLGMKFAGGQSAGGAFARIFDWFTIFVRPLSTLLAPLIGMSEFYRKAILFGLFTAFSGYMAANVKRRRKFYAEMEERRAMERQSALRAASAGSDPAPGGLAPASASAREEPSSPVIGGAGESSGPSSRGAE